MGARVAFSMSLEFRDAKSVSSWLARELGELDSRWPGAPGEPLDDTVDAALRRASDAGLVVELGPTTKLAGDVEPEQWRTVGAGLLAAFELGGGGHGVVALLPEGDLYEVRLTSGALSLSPSTDPSLWDLLPVDISAHRSRSALPEATTSLRRLYKHPTTMLGITVTGGAIHCAAANAKGAVGTDILTSRDGSSWATLRARGGHAVAFDVFDGVLTVAGAKPALARSTDGGLKLTRVSGPSVGERTALLRVEGGLLAAGAAPHPVVFLPDGGEPRPIATPKGLRINSALRVGDDVWLFGDAGAILRWRDASVELVAAKTKLNLLDACVTGDSLWILTSRSLLTVAWKGDIDFAQAATVKTPSSPWSVSAVRGRLLVGTEQGLVERSADGWRSLAPGKDVVIRCVESPDGQVLGFTRAGSVLAIAGPRQTTSGTARPR